MVKLQSVLEWQLNWFMRVRNNVSLSSKITNETEGIHRLPTGQKQWPLKGPRYTLENVLYKAYKIVIRWRSKRNVGCRTRWQLSAASSCPGGPPRNTFCSISLGHFRRRNVERMLFGCKICRSLKIKDIVLEWFSLVVNGEVFPGVHPCVKCAA